MKRRLGLFALVSCSGVFGVGILAAVGAIWSTKIANGLWLNTLSTNGGIEHKSYYYLLYSAPAVGFLLGGLLGLLLTYILYRSLCDQ